MRPSALTTASRSRSAVVTRRRRLRPPCLVERLAADGVGERGGGAAPVDLRLRALGLQLVEDARQLADLLLVELELVGEEAQRPPHAERAATLVTMTGFPAGRAASVLVVVPSMPSRTAAASFRPAAVLTLGMTLTPVQIPGMHRLSPISSGLGHRRGLCDAGTMPRVKN